MNSGIKEWWKTNYTHWSLDLLVKLHLYCCASINTLQISINEKIYLHTVPVHAVKFQVGCDRQIMCFTFSRVHSTRKKNDRIRKIIWLEIHLHCWQGSKYYLWPNNHPRTGTLVYTCYYRIIPTLGYFPKLRSCASHIFKIKQNKTKQNTMGNKKRTIME